MQPGDRIASWEVLRPLGEGGMASVYLCRDTLGEQLQAAVKVNDLHGSEARSRFLREVEALSQLRHPGIVGLLGWGEDPERRVLWLAMDYLPGENLEQRLLRGPMPAAEHRPIFQRLARALQFAHLRGIAHRDVKPANVLLSPDGARLVDFGIALQDTRTRLTTHNRIPGTPAYMPPELFAQEEPPDPRRGDIYALGALLYEAVTGEPVISIPEGLSDHQRFARVMTAKLTAEPLDPGPGFPEPLRALIREATDPEPATRLADWDRFVALLTSDADTLAAGALAAGSEFAEAPAALSPRRWPLVGLGLGVVLTLLVGLWRWEAEEQGGSLVDLGPVGEDGRPASGASRTAGETEHGAPSLDGTAGENEARASGTGELDPRAPSADGAAGEAETQDAKGTSGEADPGSTAAGGTDPRAPRADGAAGEARANAKTASGPSMDPEPRAPSASGASHESAPPSTRTSSTSPSSPPPGQLQVTLSGGGTRALPPSDIILARRSGPDTELILASGGILCEETITDLDRAIDHRTILRVHRDYLLNTTRVTALETEGGQHLAVTPAGRVPVSASALASLQAATGL